MFESYLALAQCAEPGGVNVDKYMNWVAKDARKNGHSSMYLKIAGIPLTPDETPNVQAQRPEAASPPKGRAGAPG